MGTVVRIARTGDVPDLLTAADRADAVGQGAERADSFNLGRSLLRRTAADVLGLEPGSVGIGREPGGRPLLTSPEAACAWSVGVTHTRTLGGDVLAAVVLSPVRVGIDAEPVRARAAGLAARILAGGEALPVWTGSDDAALIAAWTAKEAALKADGLGLRQGARAAHLLWCEDGSFAATTPNGTWAGRCIVSGGIAWALVWADDDAFDVQSASDP